MQGPYRIAGFKDPAPIHPADLAPDMPPIGRNRIINGGMDIDQRFEGTSKTITVHPTYTLDRWGAAAMAASKFSVQQVVDAPAGSGFVYSLKATSLSAYTAGVAEEFGIYQQIVGWNVADLMFGTVNAKTVTLSFWVKSSLTGMFCGRIKNNFSNRSFIFTYVIGAANTWEAKSITMPGDQSGSWTTDKTIGLQCFWDLGGGSNFVGTTAFAWLAADVNHVAAATPVIGTNGATWQLTGVQLEDGDRATPFAIRHREFEERLCAYYYQKSFSRGTVPAQAAGTSLGEAGIISQAVQNFGMALSIQKMRSNFTLVTYNPISANANWRDLVAGADRTFTGAAVGDGTLLLYGATGSAGGDTRIHWTADSEL